jgi:hypothetical protein
VSFSAGDRVTAGRLNRLQPRSYQAVATGTMVGPQSGVDVPGLSIPITTETDNAVYTAVLVADVDLTGSTTGLASVRLVVDGANASTFALFAAEVATDRATAAQTYRGTLGAAGDHVIKANATVMSNQQLNQYTSLLVTISEVV